MFNAKVFVVTQAAANIVAVLASMYILIPMVNHMREFLGHCALFSCGTYIETDGHFKPDWSSKGFCVYSVIVSSISIVASTIQCVLKIRLFYLSLESNFMGSFLDFVVDALVLIMVLISSILTSIGFYDWCHCVMQRFDSCDVAASVMEISVSPNQTFVPNNFFINLETALLGTWTLFVCAAFQLMLSTRKILMIHERENLIASMTQERLRYQNN